MSRDRRSVIVLLAMLLVVRTAAAQEPGVQWQHDIESAKATAQQTGRLVLVHVWAENCAPCRALEQNVFNQPQVAAALESKFVPVKLNANEYPATAQGFGITRVPTDVILSSDGQMLGRTISPATPGDYLAEVTQMADNFAGQTGQAHQVAAAPSQQPEARNPAYANLQVGTPPTATPNATPPAQPTVANPQVPNVTPPQLASDRPSTPVGDTYDQRYAMAGSSTSATQPQSRPSWPTNTSSGQQSPVANTAPWTPSNGTPSAAAQAANPAAASPSHGAVDQYAPQTTPPPMTQSAPAQPTTQPSADPSPLSVNNQYAATQPSQSNQPSPSTRADAGSTTPSQSTSQTAAGTTPAQPDPEQLPSGAPPLGFDGYCPVTMRNEWKWVPGDPQYGAIHRGRTYWFAGREAQQQFLANPDRYGPALGGLDPVLAIDHQQTVPGEREHSLDYDNQFYQFSSEATLAQFMANPQRYANGVRQAMGLPANGSTGRQVR